jgi:DNA modification methylase
MSILDRLPAIAEGARERWERGTIPSDIRFDAVMDRYKGARPGVISEPGRIIRGDNLRVAKTLFAAVRAGMQEAPALIYMDPPFFSNGSYSQKIKIGGAANGEIDLSLHAFDDKWRSPDVTNYSETEGGAAKGKDPASGAPERSKAERGEDAFERYLTMLTERIVAARDLLADDGSLWIHLDHHAAHYVKILADHIFGGPEYLLNEVIWQYSSGGATKKHFARKHDTLLFYAKDPDLHRFYPMSEKSYNRERKPYRFKGVKEYRDEGGWYTLVNMRDVWRIDMVGRTSGERTGYATQKPEALIERVVSSCTERGDLCLDMFGGSGTLAAVCEDMDRRWIIIDASPLASLHTERRITGRGAAFEIMNGAHTVAESAPDGMPAGDIPSWELEVTLENTADCGSSVVIVKPVSYTIPEGDLDVGAGDAPALKEKARISPESFVAGISAEIRLSPGDVDGQFRPEFAVYGEGRLRLPVCLSRAEADGADAEDGEGNGANKIFAGAGDSKVKRDDTDGADIEIIVRVIDVFGNVSIIKMNAWKSVLI